MKICIAVAALAAMLMCARDASAQSKAEKAFDKIYPYSIAAEVGSIIFDGLASSGLKEKGYKEKSPVFRDGDGYFSATRYYSFSGGLCLSKAALGYLFPRLKPYILGLNALIVARHTVAGVRNFRAPNRFKLTLRF